MATRPPTLSRHAADTARLAAPLAIAQLSQMAMAVTDTILLGSLGPDSLAAGGLGANLFFVVVGGDISAQDYKKLIRSGNADWVAEACPPQEILDIVGRVSAPAMHDVPVESPVVVSFTPSAGGVGNSTLAIVAR